MGDVVNLRRYRKRAARDAKAEKATESRARFGQPRAEKRRGEAESRRAEKALDGHKIEDDDSR